MFKLAQKLASNCSQANLLTDWLGLNPTRLTVPCISALIHMLHIIASKHHLVHYTSSADSFGIQPSRRQENKPGIFSKRQENKAGLITPMKCLTQPKWKELLARTQRELQIRWVDCGHICFISACSFSRRLHFLLRSSEELQKASCVCRGAPNWTGVLIQTQSWS